MGVSASQEKEDVFSLGVLYYMLLSGQSPFLVTTIQELFRVNKACKISYNNLKRLKDISPQCLILLKKMLAKNPSHRIGAMAALKHKFFLGESNNE